MPPQHAEASYEVIEGILAVSHGVDLPVAGVCAWTGRPCQHGAARVRPVTFAFALTGSLTLTFAVTGEPTPPRQRLVFP